MPTAPEALYFARIQLDYELERGVANTLTVAVQKDDGTSVTPTSGTCTVTDANGDNIASPSNVSTSGGVVSAAVTPPSSVSYGGGYTVVWSLTVTGESSPIVIEHPALVVRRVLTCPITTTDLFRLAPQLDPAGDNPVSRATVADNVEAIREAWTQVMSRIIARGRRPSLILDSSALRNVTLQTALGIRWRQLAQTGNGTYLELARDHEARAVHEWTAVTFRYDTDEDGKPDSASRRGMVRTLWLGRGAQDDGMF